MLPFVSQIAEETSFFLVTLFRVWFYDRQFSQIKFSCSENVGDVPGIYPW